MIYFPHCKINLGLDVVARRTDGFHNIETIMYPVRGLCDSLEIIADDSVQGAVFSSSGDAVDCPPESNLVVKAYASMRERYGIGGVRIHLYKAIPSGAGIGGGSADAAFTLRGLKEVFSLSPSPSIMADMAARLGSDVPFFLQDGAQFCWSKGEMMKPVGTDLTGKHIVIVKPQGVGVSTAEAYRGITPRRPEVSLEERIRKPLAEWKGTVHNVFEDHIFRLHPGLAAIKQSLYDAGAVYASMSGSGSAIYAIFDEAPSYEAASGNFVFRGVL